MAIERQILVGVAWADIIARAAIQVILRIVKWKVILFAVSFILALIVELIGRHKRG